jgi:catechol 2,3-dioxygenase-like lactoylglutathione lyase family enzyme
MEIKSIGYVGVEVSPLAEWEKFAKRLLACHVTHRTTPDGQKALALRLDEKCHRLLLVEAGIEGNAFFGFEMQDAYALAEAKRELEAHGVAVQEATPAELALRQVGGMLHFREPAGYRLELFHSLQNDPEPFVPSRPMKGFRTGDLGFGHAVLVVPDLDKSRDFYCDVLGFRVSDYLLEPNRRVFMHTNGRHHSIALSERRGFGIAHLMFEVKEFDDLGRAYDIALAEYPGAIYSTLGRHSNDHMTSFYIQTPGGFPIEYGWGGRIVDDATWTVSNVFGPSLWGHDRIGASPEARKAADLQREFALNQGITVPLYPDAGSLGS